MAPEIIAPVRPFGVMGFQTRLTAVDAERGEEEEEEEELLPQRSLRVAEVGKEELLQIARRSAESEEGSPVIQSN